MRHAVLNLTDISQLTGYTPTGLQRPPDRQDKLLATYSKELTLVETRACGDGVTRYYFTIPPARKARKPHPLGYTPLPPLEGTSHCGDTYYCWRVRTAEACTCRPHVMGVASKDYRGRPIPARKEPHPEAYNTGAADHAPTCKARAVLLEGGFI